MFVCLMVSPRSFLVHFSFCSSQRIILNDLSSYLQILSSVCSNLLGPSNEFAFQLLHIFIFFIIYQFRSVAQSCPTLRDPMDCSTWGFPVHHQLPGLPKLMSIESVMPSNHLVHLCPLLLLPSIFPSIRVFSVSQLFTSGSQSFGVSTSVLPMNTQD